MEFLRSKRKRLAGAAVVCVVLIAGLAIWWQMGQVAEAAILDPHPGLVGWWRFDEGDGSVAEDSSGYGNDGTVYGATWVDGKYGKALSFDGVNDHVETLSTADFAINDELTVSYWVQYYALDLGVWYTSISKYPSDWYDEILGTDKKLRVRVHNDADALFTLISAKDDWALGSWYHICWVIIGDDAIKLYINGVLDTEVSFSGAMRAQTGLTRIGRSTGAQYINGIIDEVRIYSRALSATEIREVFQKGPDFSSRLLAKVPKGITQLIVTLSWQGEGNINVTIESPSKNYTEDMVDLYQKAVYSTSGGVSTMLNIKRLTVSVTAISSNENWYITLEFDNVEDYRITVEVQR